MKKVLIHLLIVLASIVLVICSCTNEPAVHDHTFSQEWVYDDNFHWHSSTCGHDVVSGKANHIWDDGVITKEASHTEAGILTFSCKTCGYTKMESIPAKTEAHTFSEIWSKNETAHWHASTCGHDVVSGMGEHTWDAGVVTKEATHTEDGLKTFICTTCGFSRTEVIPAATDAHTFSTAWSSNTTSHWHNATCVHIELKSDESTHSWDDGVVTKESTHTEDGIRTFTCYVCGRTRTETIPARIDAHSFSSEWTYDDTFHWHSSTCGHDVVSGKANHVWNNGVVTKQATHTEDGILTYTCTTCGKTRTEVLPAQTNAHTYSEVWTSNELGHWHASTCGHDVVSGMGEHTWNAGVVTKEATHTEDGVKTFICTTCGFSRSEVIPAATDSHSFSPEWTYDDTFHWHSSTCGHDVVSEKTNHVWDSGVVTKAATHTEEGILTYTCTTCGRTKTEAIPAAVDAHTFSDAWSSDTESHWHNATCVHIELKSDEAVHSWDDGVTTKEATHTEDGIKTFTCLVCGRTRTESIPAKIDVHSFSSEWTYDDTFHWHSSTCGHDVVSGKANHVWDSGVVTKQATHTEDGILTYTCTTCGRTKTEAIPAAVDAHTFSDAWSSDTESHWHNATCVHIELKSDEATHSWDDGVVTKEASHTEDGVRTFTCSACGRTRTETIPAAVDAHTFSDTWSSDSDFHWHDATCIHAYLVSEKAAHSWDDGVVTKEATHTENGVMTYTCATCRKTKTEVISAAVDAHTFSDAWSSDSDFHWHDATCVHTELISGKDAHSWDEGVITLKPTCTEKGEKTYTCSICGKTKIEEVPMKEHAWSTPSVVVAPTCVNPGIVSFLCSDCPATKLEYTPADTENGHNWDNGSVITTAKCTEDGLIRYTCSLCSKTKDEAIPATGHNYKATVTNPTCTKKGFTTHKCSSCGDEYVDSETVALGHTVTHHNRVEPTCTTTGNVEYWSCSRCGNNYSDSAGTTLIDQVLIPATGHSYSEQWTIDADYHWHSSTCGHDVVSNYAEHSFPSEWTIIKKNGIDYRYRTCLDCGYEQSYGSLFEDCFDITEEGVISVKRFQWKSYYFPEVVEIPSMINGITVIGIGDMAFDFGEGDYFPCENITMISLPDTVEWIGQQAFISCTAVEELVLPESVKELRNGTFAGSFLRKIHVPSSVTYLDSHTFSMCDWLTDITVSPDNENYCSADGCLFSKDKKTIITVPGGKSGRYSIPSTVETIGGEAFRSCYKITEVTIPDSVKEIGIEAFAFCHGLTSISIPGSVVTIESGAFSGCSGLTEVTIGNGCKEIGQYAFDYCEQLRSVCIPDSVEKLGAGVFAYCSRLNDVTIGSSVKEIGFELGSPLFEGCNNLAEIRYNGTTSDWESIIKNNSCSKDLPVVFVSCIDGKSSLHEWLSIVRTEPTCLEPGKIVYTCSNCDGVYEEILPPTGHSYSTEWSSDETYHWHAATCGHSVVSNHAEHSFPDEWTIREINGIEYRYRICDVCGYEQSYGSLFEKSFDISKEGVITVKKDVDEFFPEIVEIPSEINGIEVKGIGQQAFAVYDKSYNCISSNITSISLPQTLTSIGEEAFMGCSSLVNLVLPDSVKSIEREAFFDAHLRKINIPASLTLFDTSILDCQWDLESIEVSKDNPSYCSVEGCLYSKDMKTLIKVPNEGTAFTHFTIPSYVKYIGGHAFAYSRISKVDIPDSVVSLGGNAFTGCMISEIVIPDSVNDISYAFSQSGVERLIIGNSVEYLVEREFDNCQWLNYLSIGKSVKRIEPLAFVGCFHLETISYGGTVEDWCSMNVSFDWWDAPATFVTCSDGYVGCFSGDNIDSMQPYCVFDEDGNLLKMTETPNWVAYDSKTKSFYETDEAHAEAIKVEFHMYEEPTMIIANINGLDCYPWLDRTFSIERITGTILMR